MLSARLGLLLAWRGNPEAPSSLISQCGGDRYSLVLESHTPIS